VPGLTQSGTLPSGISFTDNGDGTAALSGTPGASTGGTYALTFTAANGVGTNAIQDFTLTIDQAATVTNGPAVSLATVGTAYAFAYTAAGFPAPTFSLLPGSTLPPGLSLGSAGVIAGTPTAVGTFTGTVNAGNGVGGDATQAFSIVVDQVPAFTNGPASTPA